MTLSNQPTGQVRLTGTLDPETATILHAAIDPLTAPTGVDDTRSPGERRVDALADICRLALRTGELPDNGVNSPPTRVRRLRRRYGSSSDGHGRRELGGE